MWTKRLSVFFILSALSLVLITRAEGTKELNPSFGDYGILQIYDQGRTSFTYKADPNERLYITICEVGEIIHIGLNQSNDDVVYRLIAPDGSVAIAEALCPNTGEEGFIDTYAEAVAGPEELVGATGYDAISHTTTQTGDYYLEFECTAGNKRRFFPYFDITVEEPVSNTALLGRLWCQLWDLSCQGFNNAFRGTMFVYSDDGIVTNLQFNGIQPYGFTIFANQYGLLQSDPPQIDDRYSRNGEEGEPQYKIFLNNPDEDCFPSGVYGEFVGDVTITGCDPNDLCINFEVTEAGFVTLMLDLNGIAGWQSGTEDIVVWNDSISAGVNCIPWNSLDGLGDYVEPGQSIPIQLDYSNGITHLPLYDVETHTGGYIVELVRPNNGLRPQLFWNDTQVGLGFEETGCDDSLGCHKWQWFEGDRKTINTYWYANILKEVAEYQNDNIITVDANTFQLDDPTDPNANDTSFCASELRVEMGGEVLNSAGGTWSVVDGFGTFDDDRDLNTFYNIDAQDIAAGSIRIVLTADDNAECTGTTDTMTMSFQDVPELTIGGVSPVCANNPTVDLTGAVGNAGGAVWVGSGGVFTPDSTVANPSYTPSQSEIDAESTWLYYVSTDNGLCAAGEDSVEVEIGPAPIAVTIATLDSLCDNNADSFTLNGSVTYATGGTWSGGNGLYVSGANSLVTEYEPTATELASGSIDFSLTTVGHDATCIEESAQHTINFSEAPVVEAGAAIITCTNNISVILNGSIDHAEGGIWTGDGTFNGSDTSLAALEYVPSDDEIAAGSFYVTLTATGIGNCSPVSDSVLVTIEESPSVDIGDAQPICANNAVADLSGTFSNALSIEWSGVGSFSPSNTDENPSYILTQDEIDAGATSVYIKTVNAFGCEDAYDTLTILVNPAPEPSAPDTIWACENNPDVQLEGEIDFNTAIGFYWNGGLGSYTPHQVDLNAVYTADESEIATGKAVVQLVAVGDGCLDSPKDVTIIFDDAPVVDAGSDIVSCENKDREWLAPTVSFTYHGTSYAGIGTWSGYDGVLRRNDSLYDPSADEVAAGFVDLVYTFEDTSGLCHDVSDTLQITYGPAPTLDPGGPVTVCENNPTVELTPVSSTGFVKWLSGDGSYSPGIWNSSPEYTLDAAELLEDSIFVSLQTRKNIECARVIDSVLIYIDDAPEITLSLVDPVCADNPSISLTSSITNAGGGIWSGGFGSFSDDSSLTTNYEPTPAEINAGTVTLTFTTIDNGTCNAVSQSITVSISDLPEVDAGSDQVFCGDVSSITFNGSADNAGGGFWSHNGQGGFSTSDSILNPSYSIHADDLDDTLQFILTSIDDRGCDQYSDTVLISFTDLPSITAGDDKTVCTNDFPIKLSASGTPSQWSGGLGQFTPDAFTLNAQYTPHQAEIDAGEVTLTITTIVNGSCSAISDDIVITLPPAPEVDAGGTQTVCSDAGVVSLTGISSYANGTWTTTGRGIFSPDSSLANAVEYILDPKDVEDSVIAIILTNEDDLICPQESDTAFITIIEQPSVSAGPDQTYCSDAGGFEVFGTALNSTSVVWKSLGDGNFDPSAADTLTPTYIPGVTDVSDLEFELVLESTDNGICQADIDTVLISLIEAPTVTATLIDSICADADTVQLSGTTTSSSGSRWYVLNGTGNFSPSAFNSDVAYLMSSTDKGLDSIVFVLEADGIDLCNPVYDTLTIPVTPAPIVDLGTDIDVCSDSTVDVLASLSVATAGYWSTSGTGVFADSSLLSTTYTPSSNDLSLGLTILNFTSTSQGICKSTTGQLRVNYIDSPEINAGGDLVICDVDDSVRVVGQALNTTAYNWSTLGDGVFDTDNGQLEVKYSPGNNDVANTTVDLVISTVSDGTCDVETDTTTITINASPTIDIGSDFTICNDTTALELISALDNASGVKWTALGSSPGQFYPNSVSDTVFYAPSSNDLASDSISIVIQTIGNGACSSGFDTLNIEVLPVPEVVITQSDMTICSNLDTIPLSGSVDNATGGFWSTTSGNGSFTLDSSLTSAYLIGSNDALAGTITLVFESYGNGVCTGNYSQSIDVSVDQLAEINSGGDLEFCSTVESIAINSVINHAGGVEWSASAGVFTPNRFVDEPTYRPTTAVKNAGMATLSVVSLNNGVCPAISDSIEISFYAEPTIESGTDSITICETGEADLSGASFNVTDLQWTSTGSGSFFPSEFSQIATYVPSSDDVLDSTLTLYINSLSNGPCPLISDSLVLSINPEPTISASSDVSICSSTEVFNVDAVFTNAEGVAWEVIDGTGGFADSTLASTVYDLSQADREESSISVLVTTIGTNTCSAVSTITSTSLTPAPELTAGPDKLLCSDAGSVNIDGIATNIGTLLWESESGLGSFAPDDEAQTVFTPDAIDLAKDSIQLKLRGIGNGLCTDLDDLMTIYIVDEFEIDAGDSVVQVCLNDLPLQLNGSGADGVWSGGTGDFEPNTGVLNPTYNPHDDELTQGFVTLTLTSISNSTCAEVEDTIRIEFLDSPELNFDSTEITVCGDTSYIELETTLDNATGVIWSSNSKGTILPNDSALTATYELSAKDITNGFVKISAVSTGNGLCPQVKKTKRININPIPTVSAGQDQTLCADADTIDLSGDFENTTGLTWNSLGTGSFVGGIDADVESSYLVSSDDSSAFGFSIVAQSDDDGLCKVKYDTMNVVFTQAVAVDLGAEIAACEDEELLQLGAELTVATGVSWSTSGSGSFTPSVKTIDAVYAPSENDVLDGVVTLYAATTGNGTCKAVNDSVEIVFEEKPVVDVSDSLIQVCQVQEPISIDGTVSVTGTGKWSTTGTGTFSPNDSTLTAIYNPSIADLANGGINLFLTSTGSDVCDPSIDVTTIDVFESPVAVVNAGFDLEICADAEEVQLQGSLSGSAKGATWTTNGAGEFTPHNKDLNAIYVLSVDDTLAGEIEIYLTSDDDGVCTQFTDTMVVTITDRPTLNAGDDIVQCEDNDRIVLNPVYTVSEGIEWTTTGSGSFEPSAFTDSVVYRASESDIETGVVGFIATTTINGTCKAYTDAVKVIFTEAPTVSAINDFTVCANMDSIEVDGLFTIAGGVVWSSSTAPEFADSTSLSTSYAITDQDRNNGLVVLGLTTTDNGNCTAVSDELVVEITDVPTFSINVESLICGDYNSIELNGTAENTDSIFWSVRGTGSFISGKNSFPSTYTLSEADKEKDSLVVVLSSFTDDQCYSESDSAVVYIEETPFVEIAPSSVCSDFESIQLTASVTGAGGVKWLTDNGGVFSPLSTDTIVQFSASQSDMANGYANIFVLTTSNGTCQPVGDTIEVAIKELPEVDAGLDFVTCVGMTQLVTGVNDGASSYTWLTESGVSIQNGNILSYQVRTDTSFVLRITDVDRCVNYDTVDIIAISPPTFNLIADACYDPSIVLDADPQNEPNVNGAYQWYRDGMYLVGESDPRSLNIESSGSHLIQYSYEACLSDTSTSINPLPELSGEDKLICVGGSTLLETTDIANAVYFWSDSLGGTYANDGNTLAVTLSDTNTFYVNVTDEFTCENIDTIRVIVVDVPNISLGDTTLCEGSDLVLDGEPLNIADTINSVYAWTKDGESFSDSSTVNISASGVYIVTYTLGECVEMKESEVTINPLPEADNELEVSGCLSQGEPLTLDAGEGTSYVWLYDSSTTRTIDVTFEDFYFVEIYNEYGCMVKDSVYALDECPPELYVSSAFVPGSGGDDANWKVFGEDFEQFSVKVYNRWGEVIFYSEDPDFEWDGTYLGKEVVSGVYPYVIRYRGTLDGHTEEQVLEGSVTIIR